MKPLSLEMSAFGSYAEKVLIDFTEVQHGIFLITGDTGAGKTTIFDAITYALYDQTSGGRRDGNMMRSQYASEDTETYVKYTFLYQDRTYTIRRNPEYMRLGRRRYADGSPRYVKESPKVELILEDGTVYKGKKRETDQKIAEIIGLDVNQFTQIAMIAQGDFLKLLHAESKERKKIFSKIFQTKFYYKVQEELKKLSTGLYIQLEDVQKDLKREAECVELISESENRLVWEEIKALPVLPIEETLETIRSIIKEGAAKEKEERNRLTGLGAKLEALNVNIRDAGSDNMLLASYEKAKEEEALLAVQKVEYQNLEEQLNTGRRAQKVKPAEDRHKNAKRIVRDTRSRLKELYQKIEDSKDQVQSMEQAARVKEEKLNIVEPAMTEQIMRAKDALPQYDILDAMEEELKKCQKRLGSARQNLDETEKSADNTKMKIQRLNEIVRQLADSKVKKERLSVFAEKMSLKKKELEELGTKIKRLKNLESKCLEGQEKSRKDISAYRKASDKYEALYEAFLNEQAGILAAGLKTGEPCPVCGSTVHPSLCIVSAEAPTQQQVETAKRARDEAEADRDKSGKIYEKLLAEFQAEQKVFAEEYVRILGKQPPEAVIYAQGAEPEQSVREALDLCIREYEQTSKELSQVKDEVLQCEQAQQEVLRLENEREKVQEQYEQLKVCVNSLEGEEREKRAEIKMKSSGLTFESRKEAVEMLDSVTKELAKYQDDCRKAQQKAKEVLEKLRQQEGQSESTNQALLRALEDEKNTKEEYTIALKQNKFQTDEEYEVYKSMAGQLEEWEQNIQAYKNSVHENAGKVKTLREQTEGKDYTDIEPLVKEAEVLKEENESEIGRAHV